jgi:hypothetical protein
MSPAGSLAFDSSLDCSYTGTPTAASSVTGSTITLVAPI